MVQTCQSFNEHIDAFIPELVTTGREEVERIVSIEVVVTVEMSSNEIADLILSLLMEILELMHSREFFDVETIGEHAIRLPFQQMLGFIRCDVGYGSEDIGTVCCRSFYAVPMVDTTFTSFCINVEVLEVVVKVDRARAKVSPE